MGPVGMTVQHVSKSVPVASLPIVLCSGFIGSATDGREWKTIGESTACAES